MNVLRGSQFFDGLDQGFMRNAVEGLGNVDDDEANRMSPIQ